MGKKAYSKPTMEKISFELNDGIASGCGLKVYNHTVESCASNPTDEWLMMAEMTGANLTDDNHCAVPLEGYCYFTSNGTGNFLFNS